MKDELKQIAGKQWSSAPRDSGGGIDESASLPLCHQSVLRGDKASSKMVCSGRGLNSKSLPIGRKQQRDCVKAEYLGAAGHARWLPIISVVA